MAGRIPIRARVADQSQMPVAGTEGVHDWVGVIPFDGLPQGKNPPEGYLATANNRTMAPDYPYFIGGKFDFDYRIRRIRQLVTTTPRHTLDSMAAMQMDSLSPAAQELVAFAAGEAAGAGAGCLGLHHGPRCAGALDLHRLAARPRPCDARYPPRQEFCGCLVLGCPASRRSPEGRSRRGALRRSEDAGDRGLRRRYPPCP